MAKTLNQFLEGYLKVKSADEQKFIDKHVTAKNPDRNGNGDDVFKGSTKPTNRRKERHGYEVGEDEKVYEALKGGQHKIDANKNGKLDAHDFKLLRAKKKVAEAVEELEELSKKTLGSYVKKAGVNRTHIAGKQKSVDDAITGVSAAMRYVSDTDNLDKSRSQLKKVSNRLDNKDFNRQQGISKAVDRLTKEEAEGLDELSRGTVQRYSMKAKSIADNEGGKDRSKGRELAARKNWGGTSARVSSFGIKPAKIPTTNEEAEQVVEGQKPYVSSESGGVGRSAVAHVLDSKGKIVQSFHKKEHGAGYMKKASDYLDKNYNKMKNEEAEGLDELSNATLGSYERKSGSDRSRDAGNQMAKRKQLGSNRVKVASTEMNKTRPKFEETSYASNIASAAAKKYGLAERSQKIDSATLAKLRKEEKLVDLISDISEAHQRTIITVFEKLNDDNKTKFLEACDTPDGVEQMLDFAINNRGE